MNRILTCILATGLAMLASAFVFASQEQGRVKQAEPKNPDAKIVSDVRAVIDEQAAAWNRGEIEGFMDGYARSPETTFVSDDTIVRGWQTVLDRYKKAYDTRAKMGTLAFTELEITPLGGDTAVALGHWRLTREGDAPRGRFTLILRRTSKGWYIIHDHTSSAPTVTPKPGSDTSTSN